MNQITIKATSIASVEVGNKVLKLVCFQYDKESFDELLKNERTVAGITLTDESGGWVGKQPYRIIDITRPPRFTKQDVLYVELAPAIEGTHYFDDAVTKNGRANLHAIGVFRTMIDHSNIPPTPFNGHGEFVNIDWKLQTVGAHVFNDFPPDWATHILWFNEEK